MIVKGILALLLAQAVFSNPGAPNNKINLPSFSAKKVTYDLLGTLPERSKTILTDRYGLSAEGEQRTLDAIGSEFGITRERVRQIGKMIIYRVYDKVYSM